MPLDEARDIFPCDKDHAFGVYYKDPTFAKRVEARMQQLCVRGAAGWGHARVMH